ncbi:MAG: protealysin inhibitor emfourin [Chloroflexota bacterium]
MRIQFERTGGFAGMKLTYSVDSDTLPADQAKQLNKMVDAAKLFDIIDPSGKAKPAADQFHYRLVVESAGKQKTITTTDTAASDNLHALLDWLTTKARTAPKT